MVTTVEVRRLALSLPGSAEQDHHGKPSFRVRGKIFATLPDEGRLNVMVDECAVRWAVGAEPVACEELWWGRRLRGVRVDLHAASRDTISELLADAWRSRAGSTS